MDGERVLASRRGCDRLSSPLASLPLSHTNSPPGGCVAASGRLGRHRRRRGGRAWPQKARAQGENAVRPSEEMRARSFSLHSSFRRGPAHSCAGTAVPTHVVAHGCLDHHGQPALPGDGRASATLSARGAPPLARRRGLDVNLDLPSSFAPRARLRPPATASPLRRHPRLRQTHRPRLPLPRRPHLLHLRAL